MREKFGNLSGRPDPKQKNQGLTLWHEMSGFATRYDVRASSYEQQAKKHQMSVNSMLEAISTAQNGMVTWGSNPPVPMSAFMIQFNVAKDIQKDLENKALVTRAAQKQYTRYATDAKQVLLNSRTITGPKGEYLGDKEHASSDKKLTPLPGLDRPARRTGRLDGHTYTLTPK